MAIPTSIKTLLSGDVVEWARIELKKTWDPAASLKTICAFANDLDNWGGGYIIIGVQEVNGRPIYPLKGVQPEKLDSFQKSIFAKCKLLRPSYTPIISVENTKISILSLYGVQVEIIDHIHHRKLWKKIIKKEYIIFVKHRAL